jgi:hypothetical protein
MYVAMKMAAVGGILMANKWRNLWRGAGVFGCGVLAYWRGGVCG